MRGFASIAICILAAGAANAFDSAEWLGKRELLLREAERLRAAYSNCLEKAKTPAEDVTMPIETFEDGSVKSVVAAKKAQFFQKDGMIWAEGVVITKFAQDGSRELCIEAERCVVDRMTKSGWAEGRASFVQGGTRFGGENVYFSSPESYVHVCAASDFETSDAAAGGAGLPQKKAKSDGKKEGTLKVRSRSSDIDRKAGVAMLEGGVRVEHSDGYALDADSAYLFIGAENELNRIVASGNVAVSNGARRATCPLAVYRRAKKEIEMFGDGKGAYARLEENEGGGRELEGRCIRFWLDTEQVEVDEPRITVGTTGGKGVVLP